LRFSSRSFRLWNNILEAAAEKSDAGKQSPADAAACSCYVAIDD